LTWNENSSDNNGKGGKRIWRNIVVSPVGIYDPEIGDPGGEITPGTAFEDAHDDWQCPICFVSKDEFEVVEE
jgi:rubredoxin